MAAVSVEAVCMDVSHSCLQYLCTKKWEMGRQRSFEQKHVVKTFLAFSVYDPTSFLLELTPGTLKFLSENKFVRKVYFFFTTFISRLVEFCQVKGVPEQPTLICMPLFRSWHKIKATSVRVAVPSMG
jgi:hypothetical protein